MFFWADRLRNLATIMVVLIHVSAPVAQERTDYATWAWWSGNLLDSISRPAVPLFVMLSGFLLLGKDYPLGDFLRRRFARVVVPALVWMPVYAFYNYQAHGVPATFGDAVAEIVRGPVHYHLWFIYLILGLYLLYPLLRPWVKQAGERDFLYIFVLCILGTWVYKLMSTFLGFTIGIQWELFTNHLGYFLLGYYLGYKPPAGQTPLMPGLRPWPWTERQLVWIAIGLIALGTALTAGGTYWLSLRDGKFHPMFFDYLTANVSIATAGWFLLAQRTFNGRPLRPIERDFAAASFGIYFLHVLVMDWWAMGGYWYGRGHPAKMVPVLTTIVVLTTFLAVALIRALPGGKRIT
jgi:surface polysaccharide O-acyltransferase-like enzyme